MTTMRSCPTVLLLIVMLANATSLEAQRADKGRDGFEFEGYAGVFYPKEPALGAGEIQFTLDERQLTFAARLGRSRKAIQRLLRRERGGPMALPPIPGKLDGFRERIREMAARRLTVSRILRELREAGYTGGRTILADFVRTLRGPQPRKSRVKRRFTTPPGQECQIDFSPYRVPLAGRPVNLTVVEFKLLGVLAKEPGRVFSRAQLIEKALGYDFDGFDRTIDVHILKLRRKLEPDPDHPRYIKTVYGAGYKFSEV